MSAELTAQQQALLAVLKGEATPEQRAMVPRKHSAPQGLAWPIVPATASPEGPAPAAAPDTIPNGTLELETRKQLVLLKARAEAKRRLQAELDADAPGFDLATVTDLAQRADDGPRWRVEGLMPAEGSTLLTAQRKTGKTTLVANLARSILTGEPFLGAFAVTPASGTVAILNYEVSAAQIGRWLSEVGVPGDRCLVVNLRGRRNPLGHEGDREKLAELLREHEVETLVVDPFANAFTGESQNDNSEAKRFLLNLDEFARSEVGAADVVLTNHAGWDQTRTRGASALEDWGDSLVLLTSDAQGQRKLSATGRDVLVPEGFLDFDPRTLRLTFDGTTNRVMAEKMATLEDLAEAIVNAATQQPGMGTGELKRVLRAAGHQFRTDDVQSARALAVASGRVELRQEGQKSAAYPVKDGQDSSTRPNPSQPVPGTSPITRPTVPDL